MPPNHQTAIAVLGAGSWGTTLAILLSGKGFPVRLWEYRPDAAERLRRERENREFLPGIRLPDALEIHHDAGALSGVEAAVLAIPSQYARSVLERLAGDVPPGAVLINAAKGIEEGSLKRPSEVVAEFLPDAVASRYAALSGPSHAEEVSRGLPTTVVAASPSLEVARRVQEIFFTPVFRVYASPDLVGVELGGALKNVIAIATGICDGLGFGDNTKGALLTRGLAEITRLGVKLGGQPRTFAGLSGMGDLIATAMSRHSRNRRLGEAIGKGMKLEEALAASKMVVEGVGTAHAAVDLARRHGVELPIAEQVRAILYDGKSATTAIRELLTRDLKAEPRALTRR